MTALSEDGPGVSDSKKVWTWWTCLRAIAVFNMLVWAVTCLPLIDASSDPSWQVTLSGIFVAVCAFRSWLPRVDLERYCLVDSPLSGMFVGRSAATVAEICFAAQVAFCVRHLGVIAAAFLRSSRRRTSSWLLWCWRNASAGTASSRSVTSATPSKSPSGPQPWRSWACARPWLPDTSRAACSGTHQVAPCSRSVSSPS